jgi:hypothetical protein
METGIRFGEPFARAAPGPALTESSAGESDHRKALDGVAPPAMLGVLLATLTGAAAIATVTAFTQGVDDLLELLGLSAAFALPIALVVRTGHLGWSRWQLPTPGAFVLFFWLLGLSPSLIEVGEARMVMSASEDAVLYGRCVAWAWFVLFALAMGRAKEERAESALDDAGELGLSFIALSVCWCICAVFAARYNALSFHRASEAAPETGSAQMSLLFLYLTLTPMLMPAALLTFLRAKHPLRAFCGAALVAGAGALFVFSSRRLWIVSLFLCLIVAQSCTRTFKKRWLAVALIAGLLGTGPLVFIYREARHASGDEGVIGDAWGAVTSYVGDERVREEASIATSANLRSRTTISSILFGATDYALARGPHLTPSPLEAVVLWVPSFVWSGKNDYAQQIDVKQELFDTGRFPKGDIPVSPITEFIFEFGVFAAPLGGIAYGLAARLANRFYPSAIGRLSRFVPWMAFFTGIAYFDAGTTTLSAIREPIIIGILLSLLAAIWRRIRAREGQMAIAGV